MKTITMYELLGLVKDGKAPKKIKWEDTIYAYSDYDKDYLEYPFSDEEYKGLFCMKDSILTQYLNDEVEVCSTGLTVKEAEENFYKISEALYKEANKKIEKEDEILDNLEEEKKIPEKLDDFTIAVGKVDESNIEEYIQTLFNQQYEIFNKINSIIDYLKSKVE